MMQSTSAYLEELTRRYWELSSIRQGVLNRSCSVGQAIKETQHIASSLNPTRRLAFCVHTLAQDIVNGD